MNVNKSKFKKTQKSAGTSPKKVIPPSMNESQKNIQAVNQKDMKFMHRPSNAIKIISNYFSSRLSLSMNRAPKKDESALNELGKLNQKSKFSSNNGPTQQNASIEMSSIKMNEIEVDMSKSQGSSGGKDWFKTPGEDQLQSERPKSVFRGNKKRNTRSNNFNLIFEEESKYDDDEDYEGDAMISAQILKPSKLLQIFKKSELTLVGEFYEDLKNKNRKEVKFVLLALSVGNLFQLLTSISISKYYDRELLIMLLKALFSIFLILLIPFSRYFYSGLKTVRYLMILAMTFGIVISGLQSFFLLEQKSPLKTVQLMEISLIYFVASNIS